MYRSVLLPFTLIIFRSRTDFCFVRQFCSASRANFRIIVFGDGFFGFHRFFCNFFFNLFCNSFCSFVRRCGIITFCHTVAVAAILFITAHYFSAEFTTFHLSFPPIIDCLF